MSAGRSLTRKRLDFHMMKFYLPGSKCLKNEPDGRVPASAAVDALFVAQQGQDLVSPFEVKKNLV